jgi:hypothetical protein
MEKTGRITRKEQGLSWDLKVYTHVRNRTQAIGEKRKLFNAALSGANVT